VKGTIWEKEVDDSRAGFDRSELESLFASAASGATRDRGVSSAVAPKKEVAALLDPKTANNMAIAISRFKLTPEQIAAALTSGDEIAFSTDQLASLIAMLPSAEDVELCQSFDGPVETLGKAEQFVLAISAVPRYAARTKCMLTRATFGEKVGELSEAVGHVSAAAAEVRGSGALRSVLELTLGLGNHLNGGTSKGGAWGFKLDSLSKIISIKTADGKSTLLHYIARLLQKEADADGKSKALLLAAEMPTLEAAARVVWADEAAEVTALTAALKQVETQVKLDKNEAFTASLGGFHSAASSQASQLAARHKEVDEACSSLNAWFGENKDAPPEQIFSTLHNFTLMLEKAHRYNLECDEKERRKNQPGVRRVSVSAPRPPGGAPAAAALNAGVGAELAAKLAKRNQNRGNLVDNVEAGMENGTLLRQRRQESFAKRNR